MRWTKDRPTKEGHYLWRKTKRSLARTYAQYWVEEDDGEIGCWEIQTATYWPTGGWWYGPLSYPDA